MLLSLKKAVSREPLAFIAILVALLPHTASLIKDHLEKFRYEIECAAPLNTDFGLADGFLYYLADCIYSNTDSDPISIINIEPVALNGSFSRSLIRRQDFIPELTPEFFETSGIDLTNISAANLPVHLSHNEALSFRGLFAFPIGGLRIGESCETSAPLELVDLSHGACFEKSRISPINSILNRIHFGFDSADSFGIRITLSNRSRIVLEFNTKELHGYRCDDSKYQIACPNFDYQPKSWLESGLSLDVD
ncbi:hypothetical protein [Roseivivax sp. CAU 1753]